MAEISQLSDLEIITEGRHLANALGQITISQDIRETAELMRTLLAQHTRVDREHIIYATTGLEGNFVSFDLGEVLERIALAEDHGTTRAGVQYHISDDNIRTYLNERFGPELTTAQQRLHDHLLHQRTVSILKEIRKTAEYDALTGLPNRRYLNMVIVPKLDRIVRNCLLRDTEFEFSVGVIDVNDFKLINDGPGRHSEGDRVLKQIAETLTTVKRGEDIIGRPGGDELYIVLFDILASKNKEVLLRYGDNVSKSVFTRRAPQGNVTTGRLDPVTLSIGAYHASEMKKTIEFLYSPNGLKVLADILRIDKEILSSVSDEQYIPGDYARLVQTGRTIEQVLDELVNKYNNNVDSGAKLDRTTARRALGLVRVAYGVSSDINGGFAERYTVFQKDEKTPDKYQTTLKMLGADEEHLKKDHIGAYILVGAMTTAADGRMYLAKTKKNEVRDSGKVVTESYVVA